MKIYKSSFCLLQKKIKGQKIKISKKKSKHKIKIIMISLPKFTRRRINFLILKLIQTFISNKNK